MTVRLTRPTRIQCRQENRSVDAIIQAIDAEIQRFQQVRALLAKNSGSIALTVKTGKAPAKKRAGRRRLSAEARARIDEAQRKRGLLKRRQRPNPRRKPGRRATVGRIERQQHNAYTKRPRLMSRCPYMCADVRIMVFTVRDVR